LEATSPITRNPRLDLMHNYKIRTYGGGCDRATLHLIQKMGSAKGVVTDRLHASLLAALAGTPVCIVENSYGKLGAVWDLAMEDGRPFGSSVSLSAGTVPID